MGRIVSIHGRYYYNDENVKQNKNKNKNKIKNRNNEYNHVQVEQIKDNHGIINKHKIIKQKSSISDSNMIAIVDTFVGAINAEKDEYVESQSRSTDIGQYEAGYIYDVDIHTNLCSLHEGDQIDYDEVDVDLIEIDGFNDTEGVNTEMIIECDSEDH